MGHKHSSLEYLELMPVRSKICRFCGSSLIATMCDLGMQPLSNAFLSESVLHEEERYFPLEAMVCSSCFLAQIDEYESPKHIFSDYAYFSSFSDSWLAAAQRYVALATERLELGRNSFVVELGSNDGYLLQYFAEKGTSVLGIDPAANCAAAARTRGVDTLVAFFDTGIAAQLIAGGRHADLIIGNNVLAQVPGLNDFVEAMALLLAPGGTATIEVPHLLRLLERVEYDTIYHEHFSYFSLATARRIFAAHGLDVVDVEELPSHGGSIRIWLRHNGQVDPSPRVDDVLAAEAAAGLTTLEVYATFSEAVIASKMALWEFLISAKRAGKVVAGYGAAAKGNTLLNYCGIRRDLLAYVVDRNPYKQHRYLPGSHIPIRPPDYVAEARPDYLLILPWNLADEISAQMDFIRDWGAQFVTAIPSVRVF